MTRIIEGNDLEAVIPLMENILHAANYPIGGGFSSIGGSLVDRIFDREEPNKKRTWRRILKRDFGPYLLFKKHNDVDLLMPPVSDMLRVGEESINAPHAPDTDNPYAPPRAHGSTYGKIKKVVTHFDRIHIYKIDLDQPVFQPPQMDKPAREALANRLRQMAEKVHEEMQIWRYVIQEHNHLMQHIAPAKRPDPSPVIEGIDRLEKSIQDTIQALKTGKGAEGADILYEAVVNSEKSTLHWFGMGGENGYIPQLVKQLRGNNQSKKAAYIGAACIASLQELERLYMKEYGADLRAASHIVSYEMAEARWRERQQDKKDRPR